MATEIFEISPSHEPIDLADAKTILEGLRSSDRAVRVQKCRDVQNLAEYEVSGEVLEVATLETSNAQNGYEWVEVLE